MPPVHAFWKWLFWLLPFAYFFAYAFQGFSVRDDGFILGYAWRILCGELPHRDFIYVRPAVPCYVHALAMLALPDRLEIIGDRLLCYVMAAVANYWFAAALDRCVPLARFNLNKFVLASIAFIFSVNDFPPMAWTTTDGVFFTFLGFYLLTRGPRLGWVAGGMLAVILGLLCKQSFFLMPVAALCVVLALHGWGATGWAVVSAALIGAVMAGTGAALGILRPFLEQTTNTTGRGDIFLYSGLVLYENWWYLAVAGVLLGLRLIIALRGLPASWARPVYGLAVAGVCAAAMGESLEAALRTRSFYTPVHLVRSLLFLGAFSFLLQWRPRRDPGSILPGVFILLSWSCSATNGYTSPALCSGPLVFAIFHVGMNLLSPRWARFAAQFLLWGGLATYAVANQFPYNSPPRWKCTKDMGELFPKASFIKADPDTYDRYKEMKELVEKYGDNFKTLPCVPMSNYLTNTRSPLPLDWPSDFELPGDWKEVAKKLDASDATVFFFKDISENEMLPYQAFGGINSTLTYYVTRTWKRIETGRHFDVYQNGS